MIRRLRDGSSEGLGVGLVSPSPPSVLRVHTSIAIVSSDVGGGIVELPARVNHLRVNQRPM